MLSQLRADFFFKSFSQKFSKRLKDFFSGKDFKIYFFNFKKILEFFFAKQFRNVLRFWFKKRVFFLEKDLLKTTKTLKSINGKQLLSLKAGKNSLDLLQNINYAKK